MYVWLFIKTCNKYLPVRIGLRRCMRTIRDLDQICYQYLLILCHPEILVSHCFPSSGALKFLFKLIHNSTHRICAALPGRMLLQVCFFVMARTHRNWNILNWNIRGINDSSKWLALRNKISETNCDIVCLQETKKEFFDHRFIKNFYPKRINKFDFLPSIGASGGLLIAWNDSIFMGETLFQNDFSISVRFTSKLSGDTWILTNIYGPCQGEARNVF